MSSQGDARLVALITGANRGLGLEVSRQLGKRGYRVLLGCRSESKGREAEALLRKEGIDAQSLPLDVASAESIAAARQRTESMTSRLDVLVNNAAIHYDSWERVTDVDWKIVDEAFETNTLGAWRVALEFLPLLRRSAQPRIVNVSSEAGSLASLSGDTPAYSLSKVAMNALTVMLARQLKGEGILVNAVCPGWTATETGGPGGRPVEEGAASIVWAAVLSKDGPSGGFFRDGRPLPW